MWLWLYSGVVLIVGVLFLFFPARVRSWLFPNARPSGNPFDTRNSLGVNRFVGVCFLFMATITAYAAWVNR